MAKHPVILPSKHFKTKTEATNFFKDMLNRYQDKQELTPEDAAILFELLQRHPEASDKIGIGVKKFYRERSAIHPTSGFHIERTDGSSTDFSYPVCISGNAPTVYQQLYDACRYAVSPELIHQKEQLFRDAGGIMECAKTGDKITLNEAEYRHTTPQFKDIVDHFIAEKNITISPNMVTQSSDMQYVTRFTDRNIESAFIAYHAQYAKFAMYKKYER